MMSTSCCMSALILPIILHLLAIGVSGDDLPCPQPLGSNYTDPDGFTYHVYCGYTYQNTNPLYISGSPADFATCIKTCSDWNIGRPLAECSSAVIDENGACLLLSGTVTLATADSSNIALLVSAPDPYPPQPFSFDAYCDDPSAFNHYVDGDGTTYIILCALANLNSSPNSVADPGSFSGCVQACSAHNDAADFTSFGYCTGVYYRTNPSACYLDTNDLGLVEDATGYNSAYIYSPPQSCNLNTTGPYTTPEQDNFTIGFIQEANPVGALAQLRESTACGCAEQCSIFNRAYPHSSPCTGAEFDPNPSVSANCVLRSS